MSDRACNLCVYRELERDAKEKGLKIETRPSPLGEAFPAGVDVFLGGKWIRWFGSLPERCAC